MLSRFYYSPLIFAFCLIILSTSFSYAHPGGKTNILVLHSYNHGYVWSDRINEGIEDTIKKNIRDVEFYTTYLDAKRFPDEAYLTEYFGLFRHKFKGKRIDIIITSDDAAYQFMLDKGDELFPGVPVVFCGVNKFSESMFNRLMMTKKGQFTGVVEDVDIGRTVDTALKLHPDARQVVVINDTSEVGKALHAQIDDYIQAAKKPVRFVFLEDMNIGEIMNRVQALPKDSIILFLIYFRDRSGRIFTYDESFRMISEKSTVPIYSCWDIYNGLGVVGGLETMGYLQGETAAKLAIRIINGEAPSSIPIIENSPKQYIFDYAQLVRFNINLARLPQGSIIINRPVSFYDENKGKIWAVNFTILVLVGMITSLIINVRKKKKIEITLRESEARFKSVVDNIAIGVSLISPDMKIIALNRQMKEWFPDIDVTKQPVCYDSFNDPPRGEICSYCPTCRTLSDGQVHVAVTETPSGDGIKNFRIVSSPIRDAAGAVIYAVEMVEDMTERQKAEQALSASEAKYRALFEESKDAVFMSTPDGRYVDMNPAGMAMFGYSSMEELLHVDIGRDVYVNPEDRVEFQRALDENGFVKDYELEMKRKDGKTITVLSTVTAVRNERGEIRAYRGIRRDITEHKRLEQQLLQSQKMEAVGQLAGGIAHDFNNILTAIMGYGALLQRNIGNDHVLNEYTGQILDSAYRAAEVTKSLLAFSRKQMMNPRPTDLNDIVRGIWKLLSRLIGEDIEITITLSGREAICMVDTGQMEQVLMNLTTNARDAMPNGGKLIIKTETMDLDESFAQNEGCGEPGQYAVLSVSDTGIGINQESREKIFEPFFTTKEVGKGTGLGLAMVYGIVKQHGGHISVHSEPGDGTTFRIYLPLVQTTKEDVRGASSDVMTQGGTETILVAEDDDKLRQLSEIILSQNGYNVIQAVDGDDAVRKFIGHKDEIRLLIFDMIMPKKSGKEAYDEIKALKPDVRVIFSSGYTGDRIDMFSLGRGEFNFISKPVSPNELLRKVREILDEAE